MGIYPAHSYRRVIYTVGDTECVETRCPNCRQSVFFIVRTILDDVGLSWEIRENDSNCHCSLSDADQRWLESVAIEPHQDDSDDEDWWCLVREAATSGD